MVRLDLAGLAPPAIAPPAGISIVSLAERPDLVPDVHAVAVEAFADIPGGSEPTAAGPLEEFRARDVDRPSIPPEGFFVALGRGDRAGGRLRQPDAPAGWHAGLPRHDGGRAGLARTRRGDRR